MGVRIIAVTNNKGGCGKSTTVVNVAGGLAIAGRRVLVVDADPQANATYALLGPSPPPYSLYDSLVADRVPLSDTVIETRTPGVSLIPCTKDLSAADVILASVPGRERLLSRRMRTIAGFDYVLLDTPPSLNVLTVNSLTTANEVLIPVAVGAFNLIGITLLEDTIRQLKENLELPCLRISGAVATLADRTRVAKDTLAALREHFGELLFQTVIPRSKDIEEAHSRSVSIFAYAPHSIGGQAYASLVKEVIRGE